MGDIKLGKVDLGLHMVQSGKKRLCFDNQHSNVGDMTPVLKNVFRNVLHKQVIISLVERGNVFLDVFLHKPPVASAKGTGKGQMMSEHRFGCTGKENGLIWD